MTQRAAADTSNVVISVDGTEATQTAYKMAYSSPYNWATSQKSKVWIALETLIRRELLANEEPTKRYAAACS